MTDPSESGQTRSADLCDEVYDCPTHASDWQLLSQSGRHLCLCCAHYIWMFDIESDVKRRLLLSELDSSLRYGCGQLSRAFAQEPQFNAQILMSVCHLLFHSESQMQFLAKNCLRQLCVHSTEPNREEILTEIIQKIIATTEGVNESALDLVSDLFLEHPLQTHPLKVDLTSLVSWIHLNYFSFDDELKLTSLHILVKLYDGSKKCHLFALRDDWHLSHLKMALSSLDDQNDYLMPDSVRLVKRLVHYDSVRNALLQDHNPIGFFKLIVSKDSIELKKHFMDLICQLLEEDTIGAYLASDATDDVIDSMIPLIASNNPDLMSPTFECLNLVLCSPNIKITSNICQKLIKHIIQSLYLSDRIAETVLFKSVLASLKYVLEKKPSNELFDEFDFFSILDLFEKCFDDCELFELILKFLFQLFEPSMVPTAIPTIRMDNLLQNVLQNIPHPSPNRKTQIKYIYMASDCIKLVETFLKLVVFVKESDFLSNDRSAKLLNIDSRIELSQIDLTDDLPLSQPTQSSAKSEALGFVTTCLKAIERFMTESLERLASDSESEANVTLFLGICSCLKVMIANELLVFEEISSFIVRMLSSGHLFSNYQLLLFATELIKARPEIIEFSGTLAVFLIIMQQSEHRNEAEYQFGDSFADKYKIYENAILNFNEKLTQISQSKGNNNFYETFFALNYYFFKFDQSALNNDSIRYEYKQCLVEVVNHYLRHELSADSQSVCTVKHCLFLSSLINFEDIGTVETKFWRQFFDNRDLDFVSKYYTNDMNLIHWLFNEIGDKNLCEFAMREYVTKVSPPDNFNKKEELICLFSLINSNQMALHCFIKVIFEPTLGDKTIDIVNDILSDNEMLFVDDSIELNEWKTFCDNVFEQMPKILIESMKQTRLVLSQRKSPTDEANTVKLLSFVSRLLVSERHICDEFFRQEFHQFVHEVILFVDQQLADTTIIKIFDFLQKCYLSSNELIISEKSLTEDLSNSKLAVILMVTFLDSESIPSESKESSVFLLWKISENKLKHNLSHKMLYDLDICRIIELMNCKLSQSTIESAFGLLVNTVDLDQYLASTDKSKEQKINEIRALVFWCQNNVFIKTINLSEYSSFFSSLLTCLSGQYRDLKKHLLRHPINETLINQMVKDNDDYNLNYQLIEFLVIFCRTDCIKDFMDETINKIIEKVIDIIESQKQIGGDVDMKCQKSIDKALHILEKIDSRAHRPVIDQQIRDKLDALLTPFYSSH